MRRLLAAAAALFGLAWWRNRSKPAAADPADELRAKLAAAREADDRDEFESGEQPVDAAPDAADVETRRRAVHDRARAAIDDLQPPE